MSFLYFTEVYSEEDHKRAKNRKLRGIAFIAAVTLVFFVANLLTLQKYMGRPYGKGKSDLLALHALYIFLYMIFLTVYGIRFKRIAGYAKTLKFVRIGLQEEGEGVFLRYSEEEEIKDDVEYLGVMLLQYNDIRQDYFERRLFYDKAKPLPEFKEGDRVAFVAQGSLIIRYKITELGTAAE
ncbi:MAG: hypothetical protein II368_00405 [Clostridia bacterium]|jgi:hypothetical protein|nr:hypothetical protein [Clostridia bacterium]MBQ1942093.1 hypothetical protein [Clostridia bacterium]